MNKFYKLLLSFIFIAGVSKLQAQCGLDNTFSGQTVTLTGNGSTQTITYASGQYAILFVEGGTNYTINTCGTSAFDTQLTINYTDDNGFLAYNDDYCSLQSSVNFTAPRCGTVFVALDQYFCQNSGLSMPVNFYQNNLVGPTVSLATATDVSCAGDSTGAIDINVTPCHEHLRYVWSNGDTTQDISGLLPGTYSVIVIDDFADSATASYTINPSAFAEITHSSSITNVSCNGGANGSAMVTAGGGAGPFTYAWSPAGGTANTASGLVAGAYTCVITDSAGCMKTEMVTITAPPVIMGSQSPVICAGDSIMVGTHTYNTSGTFTDTVTAFNGCDSTVTTNLTVSPAITGSQSPVICSGDSIMVGTHVYTASGMFTDVLTAFNGCDSTVTTNLTVSPAIGGSQSQTICSGDSIQVGMNTYNTSGMFTDVLTAFNGCDSTVTTNLTVSPAITGSQSQSVCAGDSIMVGTHTYNTSGTFTDVFTAFNGCDSTVTTNLVVNMVNAGTSLMGNMIMANSSTGMYQWLDCGNSYVLIAGGINQSFTALMNGDFAVEVRESGCVDTSACVNISSTGINGNPLTDNWSIYPNPSSGMLTVSVPNTGLKELNITIIDLRGKEIYNSQDKNIAADYTKQISLEGIAKGIYYVKLNNGSELKIKKLIIN